MAAAAAVAAGTGRERGGARPGRGKAALPEGGAGRGAPPSARGGGAAGGGGHGVGGPASSGGKAQTG